MFSMKGVEMILANQLIEILRLEEPKEYEQIKNEFEYLVRAVYDCWAENGALQPTIALAHLIKTSPFANNPHRLLAYMATSEKRADNGRVLLNAMEYLSALHFTANVGQRATLREASDIVSRWWIRHSNGSSFGDELNRKLYFAAKKLRLQHELSSI